MKTVYDRLREYSEDGYYGFHMPGHKRNKRILGEELPFELDITEIEGFDDLHHAQGILAEAEERAAEVYHAEETHFLVNGSTCGILSAILGSTVRGDKVLVGRNCHKSVYHAITMNGLEPVYMYPEEMGQQGLNGPVSSEQVEQLLREEQGIRAAVLVSPTYDGVVSDIEMIAKIVHGYGIPLIVDEAHGAHFGFHSYFPLNANQRGADVVIHSTHKTMPALTQTALIHFNGKIADRENIRMYLHMLQSSSPSYILLASIDACVEWVQRHGGSEFERYTRELEELRDRLLGLKHLKLLTSDNMERSKIVISTAQADMCARDLYRILLDRYKIQMEMCAGSYVVAMTSPADTKEGFDRLAAALAEIDGAVKSADENKRRPVSTSVRVEKACLPHEIQHCRKKYISYEESLGETAAEFAYLYPPGTPILVPGERITKEASEVLVYYREQGFSIEGLKEDEKIGVLANG